MRAKVLLTLAMASVLCAPTVVKAQAGGEGSVSLAIGTMAPGAELEDLDGNAVNLSDYVKGKPALIEFWATWCEQCEALQPQLDRIQIEYGDELNVIAVAVGVAQSVRRVRRHIEGHDPGYPYLWDARGAAVRAYNATTTAIVVMLDADGTYIKEWGQTGSEDGEFRDPHALAMDSQGRLFVGDRSNKRIQIFTQEGEHLTTWYQFGRPSGVFIDDNDILYVADSESSSRRNGGYKRGIRIASAKDGFVIGFIPDPEPDPDNSGTSAAEGVAADAAGNIYGAEVGPRQLVKYRKR